MPDLKYNYYSSISPKQVDWLWYPYIPYGKITILQGDPGEGKSTFILNIAALLTRGKDMPDGSPCNKAETVIYQCSEDELADTIVPRLLAADADCDKVVYIEDENNELNFEDDRIEKLIAETGAKLCVLDPLQSFLVQDTDMQSAARMRSALGKLSRISAKYGCAIVLIGHMTKSTSGKRIYRGLGSIDIAALARSVLMIARDQDDPTIRYMIPIKTNLAIEGSPIGFAFTEQGFVWLGKCEANVDLQDDGPVYRTKQLLAEDLLLDLLQNEPVESSVLYSKGEEKGISPRTLEIVKKKLRIVSFKKDDRWYWKLPQKEEPDIE